MRASDPPSSCLRGRVLAVDDDADILWLLQQLLEAEGHLVAVAATGEAALSILSAERFDVVVLDVTLPGISGLEVGKAVRMLSASAPPKIALHTALDEEWVRQHFAGYDRFLQKPCSTDVIARDVAELLQP